MLTCSLNYWLYNYCSTEATFLLYQIRKSQCRCSALHTGRGGEERGNRDKGSKIASTHLNKVTTSLDRVNLSPSVTLRIGTAASIITNTPETALMVFTAATVVRSSPRA